MVGHNRIAQDPHRLPRQRRAQDPLEGGVDATDDGVEHTVADRGTFKFRRYREQGSQKWIEAYPAGGGGVVLLWVGKACKSPVEPNLKRKPYKIRKVTGRKRKPKKAKSTNADSASATAKRPRGKAKSAAVSARV